MKRLRFALAVLFLAAIPPLAGPASAGSIEVEAAWARATVPGASMGAAFLTIDNKGGEADRLVSAETPVASAAQVHETRNDNGVMSMPAVPALDIKAGEKIALAPGGYHIMLMGLNRQLKEGESFPLTLDFDKAGKVEVTVKIGKLGAMGPMDMPGMNMN